MLHNTDISFYQCASAEKYHLLANWLRCVHHAALLLIFVHYVAYICEATHYSKQRAFLLLANLLFAAALLADVIVTAQGLTFYFDDTGIRFVRRGIFIYAYLGYLAMSLFLLLRVRKLLFHRIMLGFYGTIAVSVIVLVIQGAASQSSYHAMVGYGKAEIDAKAPRRTDPTGGLFGTPDATRTHDLLLRRQTL